jgi:sugar phosphate permease
MLWGWLLLVRDAVAAPPQSRRYYGWDIAVALAITETISWGVLYYAFTVFFTPMEAELGWTRAELTGGLSLFLLTMGLAAYPIGAWVDRHGARAVMTFGSICACVLVLAWSQVHDLVAFYAVWFGLGICGAMILYEVAFTVVAHWFQRKRGTALAIITLTAGFSSTIFIPLCDFMVREWGWRGAVMALAALMALTTIPLHALILRRRPADLGLLPDGDAITPHMSAPPRTGIEFRHAIRGRTFWIMAAAFSLIYFAAGALRVHLIPYLISIGIDGAQAATLAGAIGVTQVMGRVIFAPLERRYSAQGMVIAVFAVTALMFVMLLIGRASVIVLFIVGFGAVQGATTLARPAMLGDFYGARDYGRIASIMAIAVTLANTAAPLTAGAIYDHAQTYQPMVILVTACAILATLLTLIAPRLRDDFILPR